jgi:Gpi18-like mannosyltransferase
VNLARALAPVRNPAPVTRLIGLLAIAVGLRWWIVQEPGIGHGDDLALFERWIRGLTQHGLSGFYAHESFCDYPPLMLLLFRGLGALVGAGSDPSSHLVQSAIKSLACAGDLAIAGLLYVEGRKLFGAGTLAAGLYLLSPIAVYDSAYWGQVDSIHTALLLAALLALRRQRWMMTGVLAALALTTKFQSVVLLPLFFFESYRIARARGTLRMLAGSASAALVIAIPFVATGILEESVSRAYVNVVGQYHEMSKNAYNLWFLSQDPSRPDTVPPEPILRLASQGGDVVRAESAWLLDWSWRRISLILFALSMATVLSLYARRPSAVGLYGTAGLLTFCFFLFPTEMHERYAYPAIAFLAVWALASRSHERGYWAFTLLLLLNFAAVLPATPLARQIAAGNLVLFATLVAGLAIAQPWRRVPGAGADERSIAPAAQDTFETEAGVRRNPGLIGAFQAATVCAWIALVMLFCGVTIAARTVSRPHDPEPVIWLADLYPEVAEQGWKELTIDRSVGGELIRLGDTTYLRGIGTHAPATIVYAIPPDAHVFSALVGIDEAAGDRGSSVLEVLLDGELAHRTSVLTGSQGPSEIAIDVHGRRQITLAVDTAGDGQASDHLDLALARFVKNAPGDVPSREVPPRNVPSGDRSGEPTVLESVELGTFQVGEEFAREQDRAHLPELRKDASLVPLFEEPGP